MIRDEADIVAETVGWMASQVDHVLVADNGSTDGTREILEGLPVEVIDEGRVGYYQSERMSELAAVAFGRGADWIIPFDCDEVWFASKGTIRETLTALPKEALIAEARVFDHVATSSGETLSPWRRADSSPLPKVACRAVEGLEIHQGNHGAAFPGVDYPLTVTGQLTIHHFPYRSPGQFIRKVRNGAAAYAATDLPESTGSHWRQYGRLSDDELREHFFKWFFREKPENGLTIAGERQGPLVHDPALG